jgi:hypothetical protein
MRRASTRKHRCTLSQSLPAPARPPACGAAVRRPPPSICPPPTACADNLRENGMGGTRHRLAGRRDGVAGAR